MQQEKFKFPRTFHFPDSGSVGSDDKIFHDWKETLWGNPDRDHIYLESQGKHALPYGWRIIVENLTAVHSIEYKLLNSLYPCIAIIDGKGRVYSNLDKEACKQLDC